MSSRENHPHSFVFPSRCSISLTQTTSRAVQFSSIKFSLCTFDSSDNTYRQDALTIYRSVCEGEEEGGDIKNRIYKSATTDRAACVPCGDLRRQLPNSRSTPLRARRHARAPRSHVCDCYLQVRNTKTSTLSAHHTLDSSRSFPPEYNPTLCVFGLPQLWICLLQQIFSNYPMHGLNSDSLWLDHTPTE